MRIHDFYYDRNGRRVAGQQENGMGSETAYDGAGRVYQNRTVTTVSGSYSSGVYTYNLPTPKPALSSMTDGDEGVIAFTDRSPTAPLPIRRGSKRRRA